MEEAAEETKAVESRWLRDQWHSGKVNNACRTAVLAERGAFQADAIDMLEKENEVGIAEMSWPSRKDLPKACGTMVVTMISIQAMHGECMNRPCSLLDTTINVALHSRPKRVANTSFDLHVRRTR